MRPSRPLKNIVCAALFMACLPSVHAAEDFRVRYNLAGTIGSEMFAPLPSPGWVGAVTITHVDGKKLTGNDGKDLVWWAPPGKVPLGPDRASTPLDPSYAANPVTLKADGRASVGALALAYVRDDMHVGGRLVFSGLLPLVQSRTTITPNNRIPSLNWPNANAPLAETKAGVGAQFARQYQSDIQGLADSRNGQTTGFGDLELGVGWLYAEGPWKVRAGAALVLPTGKNSTLPGPDIGLGNFYTLRPEAQLTYLPSNQWAFSGKAILGFNTRNRDNQLKSGDWYGLEAAVGYMTSLGPAGLHSVHVKQYRDDQNNTLFGASRFEMNGVGVFLTTRIPAIDTAVSLQHTVTTSSRNARHNNFTQVRLVKHL